MPEFEVRKNFTSYITDLVNKKDAGGLKDKNYDAMERRAKKAIEGARRYRVRFGKKSTSLSQLARF